MSKRYVTIVYEIVDGDAWSNGGNPLHYNHHGLQAVCASVGDLAEARDELVDVVSDVLACWAVGFDEDAPNLEQRLRNALEKAQRGGG